MQKIVLTLTGILVIAKLHAQCNQLIIGDNSNGQVVSSTLTGSNLDTFDLGGVYHSFYDADDDYVNKKIYMAWYYGIYRMNYDGSG
ncbi:MAG TPA: hypothetical protein VD905_11080, partial [Flavobacteriales bacterium]|nr:hypothetical protein [Flavobacteriales bacterium]